MRGSVTKTQEAGPCFQELRRDRPSPTRASLVLGPRGLSSLAALEPEPKRRSSGSTGFAPPRPRPPLGTTTPTRPRARGVAGRGACPYEGRGLGDKLGALGASPHSQLPGARTSDLESRRRREPSLWVVARAARPSPAPRGPAGRGAASGQHEPGGPAGRQRAGDGRGAPAGHPEPPPGRRRGPGESAMARRPGGLRVAAGRSDRRPESPGEPPGRRVATLGVTAGREEEGAGPGGVSF